MTTRTKPDINKWQEDHHHVLNRQFRSSLRGRSAQGYSIYQAGLQEKPCARHRSGGNHASNVRFFSESLIYDDVILVRETSSARKEAGRDPTAGTGPEDKKGVLDWDKVNQRFQTKERSQCAHAFRKRSELRSIQDDKTTCARCKLRPLRRADGIVQKTTGSWKELFDEYKKEEPQRWFRVVYSMNGESVRWNVIDTCRTCTTRWPMAGDSVGENIWCDIRWTIGPVRSPNQLQAQKTRRGCVKKMIRGIFVR